MISLLINIARQWQRLAAIRRKRPSCLRAKCVARKGHFVVYTLDQKRFEISMKYLNSCIIRGLFRHSEEELGLPGDGPITLPVDANSLELMIQLIGGKKDRNLLECDVIFSLPANGYSHFSDDEKLVGQRLLACH